MVQETKLYLGDVLSTSAFLGGDWLPKSPRKREFQATEQHTSLSLWYLGLFFEHTHISGRLKCLPEAAHDRTFFGAATMKTNLCTLRK